MLKIRTFFQQADGSNVKSQMAMMESKRQDLYLDLLRKRGQLIDNEIDGGLRLYMFGWNLRYIHLRMKPPAHQISNIEMRSF